ncbi:MAG TPA: hypothetical protein VHK27_13020, partial [Gammaproteobacteria bacterium]|nr:hypothetical protein [Gammaproteobacteria bacterium]
RGAGANISARQVEAGATWLGLWCEEPNSCIKCFQLLACRKRPRSLESPLQTYFCAVHHPDRVAEPQFLNT